MKTHSLSKRILTLALSVLMLLSVMPIMAFAAKTEESPVKKPSKLEQGTYQSVLNFTDWNQTKQVSSGLHVSYRATLMDMGVTVLLFQVTGYSQYDGIYMANQNATNIKEIDLGNKGKIPTNWTASDGSALAGFQEVTDAGMTDAALNDSFTKLEPTQVDTSLDIATFQVIGVDFAKKVGLVGYMKDKQYYPKDQCKSITFSFESDYTKKSQLQEILMGSVHPEMNLDFCKDFYSGSNYEGVFGNESWSNLPAYKELYSESFDESDIKKIEYTVDSESENKSVTATIYLQDGFKTANTKVYEAVSRAPVTGKKHDYIDWYMAGFTGVNWGTENLYNPETGAITITFDNDSFQFGKTITFETDGMNKKCKQMSHICLSEHDYGPSFIEDKTTGMIFETVKDQLAGNVTIETTAGGNKSGKERMETKCGAGNYDYYSWNIMKDGKPYFPNGKNSRMLFPVRAGWEIKAEKLCAEISYTITYQGQEIFQCSADYPSGIRAVKFNGKDYLAISAYSRDKEPAYDLLHGKSIGIGKIKEFVNVPELTKGLYQTEVVFLKSGSGTQTSMASGALEKYAFMTIDDKGNKSVYLNFHAIDMGAGVNAYLGALWNKTDADVTYLDFEVDKNGALLDNAGFNALTQFPCVKMAKIDLNDATFDAVKGAYRFNVIPPAMGAGDPFEDVYGSPIGADLMFTSANKVMDEPFAFPLPYYQKSVLRRSVDKAKLFAEADYTADSFATLKTALTAGEEYYNSLGTEDASNDHAISDEIKAKSDAIETAIKNLERTKPVVVDKTALNKAVEDAKGYNEAEYTADSFAALTKAIEEANTVIKNEAATKEEVDTAIANIQKAVDGLKSKDSEKLDVNKLPNGKYLLTAEMFKTNRKDFSMSNNAINHNVWLEVTDEGYFLTVQFKGLAIYEKFGYLMNLSYYDAGYTFENGTINGKLIPAEVLEVQKDENGNVIVDQYNSADKPYPSMIRFKLVDKASAEFVPLQVFVPIMEAIAEKTGTQQVLMKLDWTKIKADDGSVEPEKPEVQYPEVDAEDKDTGIKVHADKNVFKEEVQLNVNNITEGKDFDAAASALAEIGKKFQLFNISFKNSNGDIVDPNGTVTISFKIPEGYNAENVVLYRINEDGSKTKVNGTVENGYFVAAQRTLANFAVVDTTVTENVPDSPQTGDSSNNVIWLMIALASVLMMGATVIGKKSKAN